MSGGELGGGFKSEQNGENFYGGGVTLRTILVFSRLSYENFCSGG